MKKLNVSALIIFDHDGTLVNTNDQDYTLYSGVRELLQLLKLHGLHLSVWTARSHQSTSQSLDRLDILDLFDDIYGHDDGHSKPNAMGLERLCVGYSKDQVLHIGDSRADIEGAQGFGIEVIAACWNNPNQVQNFMQKTHMVAITVDDCKEFIAKKFNLNFDIKK